MTNFKNVIEDMAIDAVDNLMTEGFMRGMAEWALDELDVEEALREALADAVKDAMSDALDAAIDAAIEGVM